MLKHDSNLTKLCVEQIPSKWGRVMFCYVIINRISAVYSIYESISKKGWLETINKLKCYIFESINCKYYQESIVKTYVNIIESMVPDVEDKDWMLLSGFYQNATIALLYTLDNILKDDSSYPTFVADHIFECIYNYVDYREQTKDYSIDLTSNSLIQTELERQQRDLHELALFDYEHCDEKTWHEFVEHFRVRSENESALPDFCDFIE